MPHSRLTQNAVCKTIFPELATLTACPVPIYQIKEQYWENLLANKYFPVAREGGGRLIILD